MERLSLITFNTSIRITSQTITFYYTKILPKEKTSLKRLFLNNVGYKNKTANKVDSNRPITTGRKLFLTSSITGTLAKPAIATKEDQAISVPPPTQIAPICPI